MEYVKDDARASSPFQAIHLGAALAGGAARGFAHIGVLKAIDELGFPLGGIAGTSMGAIIGSLYASGLAPEEILQIAKRTSWVKLIDFRPVGGILSVRKLEEFLAHYLPSDFSRLKMPFVAVATDVVTARAAYLHSGDLPSAVMASAAYPGLFSAVEREGRILIDGGVLDNLPVDAARFLGAERVIASDVTYRPDSEAEPPGSVIELGRRAIDIMQARLTQARLSMSPPEVYIRPELKGVGLESFSKIDEIWRLGYDAALRVLKDYEV